MPGTGCGPVAVVVDEAEHLVAEPRLGLSMAASSRPSGLAPAMTTWRTMCPAPRSDAKIRRAISRSIGHEDHGDDAKAAPDRTGGASRPKMLPITRPSNVPSRVALTMRRNSSMRRADEAGVVEALVGEDQQPAGEGGEGHEELLVGGSPDPDVGELLLDGEGRGHGQPDGGGVSPHEEHLRLEVAAQLRARHPRLGGHRAGGGRFERLFRGAALGGRDGCHEVEASPGLTLCFQSTHLLRRVVAISTLRNRALRAIGASMRVDRESDPPTIAPP